jgi:hypothetical protein
MHRHAGSLTLICCIWLTGCESRPVDDAPPVATPSLRVEPAVVSSGVPVTFTVAFDVAPDAPAFAHDYTVFLHLLDDDGRMIGAADHAPATPTSQWKAGSTIEYTHTAYAPTTDYVGIATIVVGLYLPATGERLPLAGEVPEPRAVDVGEVEFRARADPYAVVFRDGWHPPEAPRGAGVVWRWSSKTGTLTFPNPGRDAELLVELDQPFQAFPVAQNVRVQIGATVLDDFDVEPGPAIVRRIDLSKDELGSGDLVDVTLVSDKTYIPAEVESLRSTDTRRLGVRVFRAHVEPKQ